MAAIEEYLDRLLLKGVGCPSCGNPEPPLVIYQWKDDTLLLDFCCDYCKLTAQKVVDNVDKWHVTIYPEQREPHWHPQASE